MEVANNFKMYLPQEFINSNYTYNLDSNYIIVRTNNNCYNNYNTQYCDCFRVYPNYNYIKTNNYSCSPFGNSTTNYQYFSSDIYNLPNLYQYGIMYFLIAFVCVYVLMTMWRVFRKVLK